MLLDKLHIYQWIILFHERIISYKHFLFFMHFFSNILFIIAAYHIFQILTTDIRSLGTISCSPINRYTKTLRIIQTFKIVTLLLVVGICACLPHILLGLWLIWSCIVLVCSVTIAESICAPALQYPKTSFLEAIPHLLPLHFYAFFCKGRHVVWMLYMYRSLNSGLIYSLTSWGSLCKSLPSEKESSMMSAERCNNLCL